MINKEISSFRDPSGYIFYEDEKVMRLIQPSYFEEYNHLMNSGLYEELRKKELLISHKEIKSNTKLGQQANEFLSKNEPISNEVLVAILVRGIIECPHQSILVVGFPEKLEHAQYFEQNILPIKLILKELAYALSFRFLLSTNSLQSI